MSASSSAIRFTFRRIITPLIKLVPKKNNLVIFSAWFGEKYIDNTKYLYEYLLSNSDFQVYWITKNAKIFSNLKSKGYPVALYNSLKGCILQLRAKVCFSTVQFSDFNTWLVCNSIYIDLGHGNMIKDPGQILHNPQGQRVELFLLNNMRYYAIVPSQYSKKYYQQVVRVNEDHIIVSDFARNDVFIDETLRVGKNLSIDKFARSRRKIVYMPTHRSDGRVRLNLDIVLPLKDIEDLCKKTDSVFIIKKHFYHRNEYINLDNYPHIVDITEDETIDPQVLLYQADILVTDYSSCFIDYLLLHRPIVFYQFDYDYYVKNERTLFIDFKEANFAPVINKAEDFIHCLENSILNGNSDYSQSLSRITSLFFDNPVQSGGRKKDKEILEQLLSRY